MNRTRQPGAREIALDVLTKVDELGSYSNLQVKSALEKGSLSAPDAALVTELVYGTTLRRNTLDAVIARFVRGGMKKLQPWVANLLRMSLYQIRFLDRIPDRAAVHEAVEIAKSRGHRGIASLVNGVLRNVLRQPDVWAEPAEGTTAAKIAFSLSHPEWLIERWLRQYGEEVTRQICEANNLPPRTTIRVNRLKISRDELLRQLAEEFPAAEKSPLTPDGIILGQGNPAATRWFREGLYTIQDESSMLVAPALAAGPGMRVLDACAAPGGKTTHIAERMENQGELVACDVHPHKRQLIEQTAERLGISIVRTRISDAAELPSQGLGQFERILLDAPCTGFGVIRRKPDVKWNKRPEDVEAISRVQYRLLAEVSKLLAPGGLMVYSTCTIEPEENQQIVERFVAEHPEFSLDASLANDLPDVVGQMTDASRGYVQLLPHQFHSDGFFISRLKRNPEI
ncbi:16S rRNA (cytosine(967)-C(5))-methyltransferase RsmB [Brevibacillus sp. B_LB10_24]|uniref:16S rRNA (cytosine(967)-C(5))-methyltransferase RsmB n=1 Tax=Brevibacillus sp. B_LB10_24 TaxID=3380645 RepID=UPI0038B8E710